MSAMSQVQTIFGAFGVPKLTLFLHTHSTGISHFYLPQALLILLTLQPLKYKLLPVCISHHNYSLSLPKFPKQSLINSPKLFIASPLLSSRVP